MIIISKRHTILAKIRKIHQKIIRQPNLTGSCFLISIFDLNQTWQMLVLENC